MIQFNPINQDYVSPVDLTTLEKSVNTLEQTHIEVLKSASELETALGQMDFNDSEFREGGIVPRLTSQIKQLIDDNTKYGNSAAAYSQLIKYAGQIASSPDIKGRLDAQKAWKENNDAIDKAKIPEAYKQMYKDQNPYYYDEGPIINPITGEHGYGSTWLPETKPVDKYDTMDILAAAAKIIPQAQNSGLLSDIGGMVSFKDALGNPCSAEYSDGTGLWVHTGQGTWEALSPDQMKRAIDLTIAANPQYAQSIQQDYNFMAYSYGKEKEKAQQNGDDSPIVMLGYTDSEGRILPLEAYQQSLFDEFASLSSYVNFSQAKTNSQNGTLEGQQQPVQRVVTDEYGNPMYDEEGNAIYEFIMPDSVQGGEGVLPHEAVGSVATGTTLVRVNDYTYQSDYRADAERDILSYINNYSGMKKGHGNETNMQEVLEHVEKELGRPVKNADDLANHFIGHIPKDDYTSRAAFRSAIKCWWDANAAMHEMEERSGDADALKGLNNYNTNTWTKDNSYGRQIINNLNNLFGTGNTIEITVGKNVNNILQAMYDVRGDWSNSDFNTHSNENGDIIFTFDQSNQNLLPQFASFVSNADLRATNRNWGKAINKGKDGSYYDSDCYGVKIIDKNGNEIPRTGLGTQYYASGHGAPPEPNSRQQIENLGSVYNNGKSKCVAADPAKTYEHQGYIATASSTCSSEQEYVARQFGVYDKLSDIESVTKRGKETVETAFSEATFDNGYVEMSIDGNWEHQYTNGDLKDLVSNALNSNNFGVTIGYVPINTRVNLKDGKLNNDRGYMITIAMPDKDKLKDAGLKQYKDYANKRIQIYAQGVIDEGVGDEARHTPQARINSQMQVMKATSSNAKGTSTLPVIGYAHGLGNTSMLRNNSDGTFTINGIFGTNIKFYNEVQAQAFAEDMCRLELTKQAILSTEGNADYQKTQIAKLCDDVAHKIQASNPDSNITPQRIRPYIDKYLMSR